jgi:hypothetical protein
MTDMLEPEPAAAPVQAPSWNPGGLAAFRFAFIYWLLFLVPLPEDLVAPLAHVLRIDLPQRGGTGSGDTTFEWVVLLAKLLLGAVGTMLWSALARHHREHARLQAGLRVYLRYLLGITMAG